MEFTRERGLQFLRYAGTLGTFQRILRQAIDADWHPNMVAARFADGLDGAAGQMPVNARPAIGEFVEALRRGEFDHDIACMMGLTA